MTVDDDGELFVRMRAADPAASLPTVDRARMAGLLEDTMNAETPHPGLDHAAATRRRSPLTWVAAAAAVALLAGGGYWFTRGADSPPATTAQPSVTTLDVPADAGAARCLVPTAELLAHQTLAFDGTVTSLADGVATLEVAHWFAGAETDLVQVRAPSKDMQALILAVDFQVGRRYLVAATGKDVAVCGFSAAYSDELAAIYVEAFGG